MNNKKRYLIMIDDHSLDEIKEIRECENKENWKREKDELIKDGYVIKNIRLTKYPDKLDENTYFKVAYKPIMQK